MCGIVGIVSKDKTGFFGAQVDLFEEMLLCDSVRGGDSTGVFGVYKNTQVRLLKNAAHAGIFIQDPRWGEFKQKMLQEMRLVVGHNRSATRGSITNENAHPFYKENIILVHNGTLYNHKEIADTAVDSEAIVHGFVEDGVQDTLRRLNGAWALVWYDLNEKKLFFARNKERPLVMADTYNNLVFASEGGMLGWLMQRENRARVSYMQVVPENTLVSISLNPFKLEETPLEEKKWVHVGTTVPAGVAQLPVAATFTPKEYSEANIFDAYPKDSDVIFLVDGVGRDEKHPMKRMKLTGVCYIPGKPVADCTCFAPATMVEDDVISMAAERKLIVTVNTVSFNTTKQTLSIGAINPRTDVWVDTWNEKDKVLSEEYLMACANLSCKKCEGMLSPHTSEFTQLKLNHNQLVESAVCEECILKAYDSMSKSHQEKIDALLAAGDSTVQDGKSVG